MAPKRNPADVVVEYFQNAPLEAAGALLAICRGILGRRQPGKAPRAARTSPDRTALRSSPPATGVDGTAARPPETGA